jgi:hypothetical protein
MRVNIVVLQSMGVQEEQTMTWHRVTGPSGMEFAWRFAMRTPLQIPVLALLLCSMLVTQPPAGLAQQAPPEMPMLTLTGLLSGYRVVYYPDGRIWAVNADDSARLSVPVFMQNCWYKQSEATKTFPITSFVIPIQFDSGALEFVGIDTAGLASNFDYSWSVTPDTTYLGRIDDRYLIDAESRRRRGMRVTISGTVMTEGDSLHLSFPDGTLCQAHWPRTMFSLLFKVKADPVSDTLSKRTALIIENDSLRYNQYSVFDTVWQLGSTKSPNAFSGLGGTNNFFQDAGGGLQVRDPLRPSLLGMIWMEVVAQYGRVGFFDEMLDSVDTVFISVQRPHAWSDTLSGRGIADVVVQNVVERSRLSWITVRSDSSWLQFRSVRTYPRKDVDPFPRKSVEGIIPFLDNGILGTVPTAYGEPTTAPEPLKMRLYVDPTKIKTLSAGRYNTSLIFTYTTSGQQSVSLPVVLTVIDTTTSVADLLAATIRLTVSPNPATSTVSIRLSVGGSGILGIVSMDGRIIEQRSVDHTHSNVVIDRQLSPGAYYAVLRTMHGVVTRSFVVLP